MSERLLTPHPCLVPSLSVRNEQRERGTESKKLNVEVTYVSRLHMVKKGDGDGEGEG